MVYVRDDGSLFQAPIDEVWRFFGSGEFHSLAHRHRNVRRRTLTEDSGEYSWEQEFRGRPEKFTMRWTAFPPVGLEYDVLEGPFEGSRFFLCYTPRGRQTEVMVVDEFISPTLSSEEVPAAVDLFFSTEFKEDSPALQSWNEKPRP